jgi:hypothetical protein
MLSVLLGCFMNLCNLIKCIENICIVNSKHVLFRLAEFATAVAVQVFVVQVQVFLVQRQRRAPDSWRRTSGGRARPCRNRAGPPPSHLHPFEKHGESNTTEAAARETTTATATATRMIGRGSTARRSGRGGRRQPEVGRDKIHDPRRRYSPPPPCLDFCSFLASVLVSTRLDLPGFPPALCNCDLGAAGEPTLLLRPIALGFARSSSDRPAAAVEVSRSRA